MTVVVLGSSEGDNAGRGNEPPSADAGEEQTVECTSTDGASVTLDGTGSSDPNVEDDITFSWTAPGITFDDATSATPTATFPLGSTTVTLTVDDGNGETDTDTVVITVEDTIAPVITLIDDDELTLECSVSYVEPGATFPSTSATTKLTV